MVKMLKNKILEFHPDTVEFVRKDLNLEKPGRIEEAVDLLAAWVQKQPHFVKKDFSPEYLESTLIAAKGLVERAKTRIDKLCTFRTLMPEMYSSTGSKKEFEHLCQFVCQAYLPKLTKEYYRTYLFTLKLDDYDISDVHTYYKYNILGNEYLKKYDYSCGLVIIIDFRKVNLLNFVSKCTPVELRQMVLLMTEGYGIRIKQIHIITQSKMIDALLALIKQVLSQKLSQRLHLHKDLDTVYNFVSKDILPEEYRGKERSYQTLNDEWLKIITSEDLMEYTKEMFKAKTDEKYRPESKFNEEYIGMPGSFRALSVD